MFCLTDHLKYEHHKRKMFSSAKGPARPSQAPPAYNIIIMG